MGSLHGVFELCNLIDQKWCGLERKEEQMVYIEKHDGEEGFHRIHSPPVKEVQVP